MSAMRSEAYEAFRSIGVPEDKALKAAAALAERDDDVAALKADVVVMKWMLGFNVTISVAVLFKVSAH